MSPRPRPVVSPAVVAYLEALAGQGHSPATLKVYRTTFAGAERALGGPLVDAAAADWSAYLAALADTQAETTYVVTCRALRRFLLWAGAPLPPALDAAPDPLPPSWRRAITAWEAWQRAADTPTTTMRTRRQILTQFAANAGHTDPAAVTTNDLVDWIGRHAHWKPETRYSHRTGLRAFYAWMHETDRMPTNPAARMPKIRRPAGHARPLPVTVLRETATKATETGDDRLALMLALTAGHGLRRAEVARVHARDAVTDSTGAPILRVHGKGRKIRDVPIPHELAARIRSADGYLFPGADDGHLSPRWVGTLLSRALGPGYTAHMGRHLFATTAYAATGDLLALQSLLGHASAATTQRYVQLEDTRRRDVVAAVSDELRAYLTAGSFDDSATSRDVALCRIPAGQNAPAGLARRAAYDAGSSA